MDRGLDVDVGLIVVWVWVCVWVRRVLRIQARVAMVARRTMTSPKAIRMSAVTQAWPVVMWWLVEKLTRWARPEGWLDQTANPSRKPMLATHRAAAPAVALM